MLGFVKKVEEMNINLANRSFSLFLITIGNVLPNHISSTNTAYDISDINLFAYIVTNQYSSDKFYEMMIDTNASKHSIVGYEQFMAYIRDIKDTTIDIAKVGVILV